MHIIFFGAQSPKGHMNIYMIFVLSRNSVEGKELLEIIRLQVLNMCMYIYLYK